MTAAHKRILVWSALGASLIIGLMLAFRPQPVAVDTIVVAAGPMQVTIDEEGQTRVHDVFTLSAPVTGELARIEAEVGDTVTAHETILASIEPVDPEFLNPRTEAQAEAAVQAAKSARKLAAAEVDQVNAELDFAATDHERARTLISEGTITRREFDSAERLFKTTRAKLATAQAALQVRAFELEQAQALLMSPATTAGGPTGCACVSITAPVSGSVLRVINPSQRVVTAGEALIEIGNPKDLEIVVDYLSSDAVRIEAGQRVLIDNWGGERQLEGIVRRVEPFGVTKVSALGIEEQRVNVIVDFREPPERWARLGHGYQVETRIVSFSAEEVLSVPLTALFRVQDSWALFVVTGEHAQLRHVTLGERNGIVAAIGDGIDKGERVIVHPSDRVIDGVRVADRS